jgi:hypothetical protein
MIQKKYITEAGVYEESDWKRLPVHYRYMIGRPVEDINELYTGIRFSSSSQHASAAYINVALYKPLSNVLFNEVPIDVVDGANDLGK